MIFNGSRMTSDPHAVGSGLSIGLVAIAIIATISPVVWLTLNECYAAIRSAPKMKPASKNLLVDLPPLFAST